MKLIINTKDSKEVLIELRDGRKIISSLKEINEYGSQVLLSLILKSLESADLKLEDLTEIEVNVGPGSYTGLKVGASVGQALGFALNIPVNGQLNKPVQLRYP